MKKILTCIFSLCLCVLMFAGCSLVEVNKKNFYKQTVARIEFNDKSKYDFSMEDLLTAYNNYGYQLAQSNLQMTGEELLNETAKLMVQRHLLVEKIKGELGELSTEEQNYLKRQTYEYINNQLSSIEDEVRVEWDRKITEDEETQEEESTSVRDAYNAYTPTVERKYDDDDTKGERPYLVRVKDDEKFDGTDPGKFVQKITDADVSAEAMKRFIKKLQENYKDLGKSYSDDEIVQKEIERLYDILVENKYISKYQEVITDGLEICSQEAVDSYIQKYKRDYELYSNDMEAYHSAMKSDASKVYYHPNSGHEYIYVTHILLKFSDEQSAQIEELKKLYKSNSISKEKYTSELKRIQSMDNTIIKYEENGVVKTTNATLAYEDIVNNVNRYDRVLNYEERTKEFNKFIYKYNDDPGIMNKDFGYVINLDTNVQDQMVKPFADESRRLYNEVGMGGMSEPILTDYGYHVIMYLKPVENVVEYSNIDNLTWQALYNVKTQPAVEKTLFHIEYDSINDDSTRLSQIISNNTNDAQFDVKKISYWDKRIAKLLTINEKK